MEKEKGFINLDKMIIEKEITVNSKNDINDLDSFNYNGDIYFFKPQPLKFGYNELVAEELLKDFNLDCAEYNLAIYMGMPGVITKNYKKDNINYISGEVLLEDYYDYLKNNDLLEYDFYPEYLNNLTDIWNALLYRYKDHKDKEKIVYKLMDKIVDLFIFDLITGHSDRHESNFEIMESEESIDLAPIYDNERILYGDNYSSVSVDYDTYNSNIEELEKFLEFSSYEYVERVKNKLSFITPSNLEKVFERIEKKNNYPIDNNIKLSYIERFDERLQIVEEILNKYIEKSK